MTDSMNFNENDVDALFARAADGLEAAPTPAPPPRKELPTVAAAPAPHGRPNCGEALCPVASEASLHQRLGQLTRMLHEALRELGYDRKIAEAAHSLPDARDRLTYIATLSGQSAEKVLGAVERGQAIREQIQREAADLAARLGDADAQSSEGGWKSAAADAQRAVEGIAQRVEALGDELHVIMMSQDFHDLTGQVIKRVADLACNLESNLVELLLESVPPETRAPEPSLSGPSVRPNAPDVVANQAQVDDLLDSLGF
jgi:chemotaxis protein CheZ